MKIMMGVDMEGITGICCREQTGGDARLYAEGAELMAGDINAAVAGLVDAGADEIIVWDNHAGSFNAPLLKLHPAASYVRGGGANRLRWRSPPSRSGVPSGIALTSSCETFGLPWACSCWSTSSAVD